MANFLQSVLNMGKDSIQTPLQGFEKLGKGDFGGAWDKWTGMFGEANRDASQIANSVGIRGWVGDHPNETIGAVVGTVLGGMYAAGAYGAGSAAGAGASTAGSSAASGAATGASLGGTAGTTGASAGSGLGSGAFGLQSSALSSTPMSTFGSITAPSSGAASSGAGSSALTYAPTQSSVLSGTGAQGIGQGASLEVGSYAPTQSTVLGGPGSGMAPDYGAGLTSSPSGAESTFDMDQFINGVNQLNSVMGGDKENQKQQAPTAPTVRGGQYIQGQAGGATARARQNVASIQAQNKFSLQNNPFANGR